MMGEEAGEMVSVKGLYPPWLALRMEEGGRKPMHQAASRGWDTPTAHN